MYAAVSVPAADVVRGDRFGDGTVVRGNRVKVDGSRAISYGRPSWRMAHLMTLAPDAPVTVYREKINPGKHVECLDGASSTA